MNISSARIAAFEILTKIESEKSFSSVLLPLYEEKLAPKDRALCHALTLGVLRNQIRLDWIIEFLTKGKKLDAAIRIILRLGLFQLIYLDKIPAHAAINEAVNLARYAKKKSAANFVNAILRRFTREKIELKFKDEIERISIETSHPSFLIERWINQFGIEETEKLARANNETPELIFRLTAKSDENTIEILKKLGLEISASETVEGAWKVSGSNEMLRTFAAEGKIYFQDEGSQIVAESVNLQMGESLLDVCAAPGSKATYVAGTLETRRHGEREKGRKGNDVLDSDLRPQTLLVAGDLYEQRVRFLKKNCENQGADLVEIVRYDAENALPFADESFDVVLIDAPCSGTGTIRHNPEIRYFLRETDFSELSAKQLKILQNASKLIKKGGRFVYSTCSLEREENEAVAETFLIENSEFELIEPKVAERFLTENNYARLFPQKDKTDGFFIAVFEKRRLFGKVLDDSYPEVN